MKKLTTILLAVISVLPLNDYVFQSFSETRVIKGILHDGDSNEPLLFANVFAPKSKVGVTTDMDGKFRIEVLKTETSLEFSYTGYQTKILKLKKNKDYYKVEMSTGTELEEIVVTAHAVRREKKLMGYSTGINANASQPQIHHSNSRPNGDNIQNWNTEDYDLIQENIFHTPKTSPLSTFSIDVDGSSYSNMRRFLDYGQQPPKDAVRIEELVNYFDYDYAEPTGEHPFSFATEMSDCPWAPEHKLLHIGLQGKRIDPSEMPPSNLVFLIDVSGSMSSFDKLPLLKQSFKILLENLREEDRIALVVYAGASGVVLESTPGNEKQKIAAALDRLEAGGGTAGASGINLAYDVAKRNYIKEGNNRVILATDGDFNLGTSSDSELERLIEKKRESGVFLTVMGFGTGNYKDNKMQKLANKGNGNHAYIDNISEARKVFVNEFGGTLFTIAKDVKLQVEFNPKNVQAYRLVGYENRMLADEDFNDDKKDAGEIGAGHTVTALYEIIPTGVKSKFTKSIDKLKYQKDAKPIASNQKADEWMHIKFRYKKPDENKSQLINHVVSNEQISNNISDNFNWSAAVASFGMILRESEFVGTSSYKSVLELANASKGKDEFGYRAEFIRMVENMEALASK